MAHDLKSMIDERYKTRKDFADAIGITESGLSRLLNGQRSWSFNTAWRASELLELSDDQIKAFFYADKVDKRQQL